MRTRDRWRSWPMAAGVLLLSHCSLFRSLEGVSGEPVPPDAGAGGTAGSGTAGTSGGATGGNAGSDGGIAATGGTSGAAGGAPLVSYFVDANNGNDANDGWSETHAWRSVAKVSATQFEPGSEILFHGGHTWHEALVVPSSGTPEAPIVFGTYGSPDRAILTADAVRTYAIYADGRSYIVYRDLELVGATFSNLRHQNAHGVVAINIYSHGTNTGEGNGLDFAGIAELVLQRCVTSENAWNGVSVQRDSASVRVEDCVSIGNRHQGFDFKVADFHDPSLGLGDARLGAMHSVSVQRCRAFGNGAHGFYFENAPGISITDVTIASNLSYLNHLGGITMLPGNGTPTSNVGVFHNTLYSNGIGMGEEPTGYGPGLNIEATNAIIKNNISAVNQATNESDRELRFVGTGAIDYNLLWHPTHTELVQYGDVMFTHAQFQAETGQQTHGLSVNPMFVSYQEPNLRLGPESPAATAGDTSVPIVDGIDGTHFGAPRPMGAYGLP